MFSSMWDIICVPFFLLHSLSGGKYTWIDIILYNSIVMCTKEIHQKLIQEEDAVICTFCSKPIQDPGRPKRYFCCDSMRLIKDGYLVCKNCGQVHDEYSASEYVDFYENRRRIRKKSVYRRKISYYECHEWYGWLFVACFLWTWRGGGRDKLSRAHYEFTGLNFWENQRKSSTQRAQRQTGVFAVLDGVTTGSRNHENKPDL